MEDSFFVVWFGALSRNMSGEAGIINIFIIFFGISVGCFIVWWLGRRQRRKQNAIFLALQANITVINASGKVLFSRSPLVAGPGTDLPECIRPAVMNELALWGKHDTVKYLNYFNGKDFCRVKMLRLPHHNAFRQKAFLLASIDINDLENVRQNLDERCTHLNAALSAVELAVFTTDINGVIVNANPKALELYNCELKNVINFKFDDVINLIDYRTGEKAVNLIENVLLTKKKKSITGTLNLICPDGCRKHVDCSFTPLYDSSNNLCGIMAVLHDVSRSEAEHDVFEQQQILLRTAAKNADMDFFMYHEQGKVVLDKDISGNLWGKDRYGKYVYPHEWVHQDDLPEFMEKWDDVLSGRSDFMKYIYRAQKDGQEHFYEITATAYVDNKTLKRIVAGIVHDITIQEVYRRKLLDANELMAAIIQNLSCCVFAKNVAQHMRYELANPLMCELTGRTEAELLNHTDKEVFSGGVVWPAVMKTAEQNALSDGKEQYCAAEIEDENKQKHLLRWSFRPITKVNGERLILGVGVDITELEQRRIEAERADKAKSYFLASVSHEIRTPLNAVIGFAELLAAGDVAEKQQMEYLQAISYSASALLQLINDVLDLSKLEAEQMDFVPSAVDLEPFCRDIWRVFELKLKTKNLAGILVAEHLPTVYVDRQRMRQILFNLIGNAVKFTEFGQVKMTVEFTPEADDTEYGTLNIAVADTGPGISAEDLKNLFRPFVQAKSMRGSSIANAGTGLGLAISNRMINRMNGSIDVKSQVGKGSEFRITLKHVKYEFKAGLPLAAAAMDTGIELKNHRILLVDDVQMNLHVMAAMLKKCQQECVAVSSGKAALDELEKGGISAVFTDIWMPEMTGVVLRQIIAERYPNLPVVAVTADSESGNAFDAGKFNYVLIKPVTLEKLRQALLALPE